MKKTLVALAALAAASAFAQSSVTIYGNLDQGVYQQRDNGTTYSKIGSNVNSTSTLGFRGTEDLGGGTTANFHLLSELSLPEGQVGSGTSGQAATSGQKTNFFTRAANISLADKAMGTVEIGRIQDAVWLTQGTFNNTGSNSFGWGAYTASMTNTGAGALAAFNGTKPADTTFSGTAGTTGVANTAYTGSAGINFAGGIGYVSPKLFNTTTLTYQKFGANFGNDATATGSGAGAAYRIQFNQGPLNVEYANTTRNGNLKDSKAWENTTYGATYQLGAAKLVASQAKNKFSGSMADVHNVTVTGLGVIYDWNAKVDTGLGYTTMKDDTDTSYKSTLVGLTARYKFSKRTQVYAGYGHGKNEGANNKQSVFYGGPAVGASTGAATITGYLVGVRHSF